MSLTTQPAFEMQEDGTSGIIGLDEKRVAPDRSDELLR
jgi:hypothetical protein